MHEARDELVLMLTDDAGIAPVNAAVFQKSGLTDVITLPYARMAGTAPLAGEIVVNAERAWQRGRTASGRDRELALYIAHGLDHLAGASDRTPALRRRMLRRERLWLEKAEAEGLFAGGLFFHPPSPALGRGKPKTSP